jgi:hypothetical protein
MIFFIVPRFYSKFLERIQYGLSNRRRMIKKANEFLMYPPQTYLYERTMSKLLGFPLENNEMLTKAYIRSLSNIEILSLHKYYNTVLNLPNACKVYHEILRRRSSILTIFEPFGLRRFLVAHLLLAGMGISTSINSKFNNRLLELLVKMCSIDSSSQFKSAISGKSIAVCGGAPSPRDNSAQINACNLSVRLNKIHTGSESSDIVYFRSERLNHLNATGQLENLPTVKPWISLKTFRYYYSLKKKTRASNILISISTDAAFDLGKLNAIPNICLDLIRNGSCDITIFNSDLNLSGAHRKGYRDPSQPKVLFNLIYGEHPAAIQFCVLKYLYKSGLIKFEDNPYFDIRWSYRHFLKTFSAVHCSA